MGKDGGAAPLEEQKLFPAAQPPVSLKEQR